MCKVEGTPLGGTMHILRPWMKYMWSLVVGIDFFSHSKSRLLTELLPSWIARFLTVLIIEYVDGFFLNEEQRMVNAWMRPTPRMRI